MYKRMLILTPFFILLLSGCSFRATNYHHHSGRVIHHYPTHCHSGHTHRVRYVRHVPRRTFRQWQNMNQHRFNRQHDRSHREGPRRTFRQLRNPRQERFNRHNQDQRRQLPRKARRKG